ncbi:MAG: fibronectin type III domain-containing protein, partial [bacterium]
FIRRMRADYPEKVILQNRGLFFFDPRRPHYEVSARGVIDLGFFESYYRGNDELLVSPFFLDNKYNVVPKLMAEANRPDGFRMLSLGYADGFNGPKPGIDIRTLSGGGVTEGYDLLMTDLQEAMEVGFRHYITSADVNYVNSFVKNNEDLTDTTPPQWSSTFNAYYDYDEVPPPNPRVGVQDAVKAADGSVTLSWDVALDMNKVSYVLYYQTAPFDFTADPSLSSATRVVLEPSVGTGYSTVWNNDDPSAAMEFVYPYEQTISGLTTGNPYYFLIRARDSKGNEDANQVVLTATP